MKTLLVHPQFSKIGGAEKVSLKIIELLISEFNADLTVLTNTEFDIQKIKSQTGIVLNPNKIKVEIISLPSILSNKFFRTRMAFLHRKAKQLAPDFTLLISTYNELDFGSLALQYIHHPMLASNQFLSDRYIAPELTTSKKIWAKLYRRINFLIANRKITNIKTNITCCNSHFINDIYKEIYDVSSCVIYPSLVDEPSSDTKSIIKDKQILNISRFAPNKNVHSLLRTFDKINEQSPGFKFIIAGHIEYPNYFRSLSEEVSKRTYDIELIPNCSREQILTLYEKSEYYINPKEYEHFGIAVLEAAKYGCLPLIHQSGGSVEIIPIPELQFSDLDQIHDKIALLEKDLRLKQTIQQTLLNHISSFNEAAFKNDMSDLIQNYLEIVFQN